MLAVSTTSLGTTPASCASAAIERCRRQGTLYTDPDYDACYAAAYRAICPGVSPGNGAATDAGVPRWAWGAVAGMGALAIVIVLTRKKGRT